MATVWLDRVGATTSTTSTTSPMALGSALSGYRAFPTANDGDTVHYSIKDGTSWETGYGVLGSSGTTLTRNVVRSSNSDALISLSGSAEVYLDLTSHIVQLVDNAIYRGFSAYGDGSTTVTLTNGATTLVSTAAKTEAFDDGGVFNPTTGIFQPVTAGLWLIGGTAIQGAVSDGSTTAVYVEHSTDGSTWSNSEKRALLWRGIAGGAGSAGGSGAYLVDCNGTTDRFRLTVYYSGTGTNTVPHSAANRDWIRFWAKFVGKTA